MVRQVLRSISRPVTRLLRRTLTVTDPWQRYASSVPLGVYGLGAREDFPWYFEGQSCVPVETVADVQAWLSGCEYVRDPELFEEADFWQHPCTFERLRKGDCEDFSLWAWRKLVQMGLDAEFVAGRYARTSASGPGHTWVHVRQGDQVLVFDTVMPQPEFMIRELEAVRSDYVPEVSVDHRFVRYVYGGYFLRPLCPVPEETPRAGARLTLAG